MFLPNQKLTSKISLPQYSIAQCKRYKHSIDIHKRRKTNNSNICMKDRKETQITKQREKKSSIHTMTSYIL